MRFAGWTCRFTPAVADAPLVAGTGTSANASRYLQYQFATAFTEGRNWHELVRVYDIKDSDGLLYAFEVPNTFLGRRGVLRVIERVPGVTVIRYRRLFQRGWDNVDVFCEFVVDGFMFYALEPFSDNSRYWIGPASSKRGQAIEAVRDEFERSRYLYGLPRKR